MRVPNFVYSQAQGTLHQLWSQIGALPQAQCAAAVVPPAIQCPAVHPAAPVCVGCALSNMHPSCAEPLWSASQYAHRPGTTLQQLRI